jgi:hypothetical protein
MQYNITLRRVRATTDAVDKLLSITHCECVFATSGILHAMRVRHIVICSLSGCTMYFHIISQTARFSEEKLRNVRRVFRFSLQPFFP